MASFLNSFDRETDLRQDQGVLRSIVVIEAGLLGVHLVVDDGQLAQTLHKSICFRCKHCGFEKQKHGGDHFMSLTAL